MFQMWLIIILNFITFTEFLMIPEVDQKWDMVNQNHKSHKYDTQSSKKLINMYQYIWISKVKK